MSPRQNLTPVAKKDVYDREVYRSQSPKLEVTGNVLEDQKMLKISLEERRKQRQKSKFESSFIEKYNIAKRAEAIKNFNDVSI